MHLPKLGLLDACDGGLRLDFPEDGGDGAAVVIVTVIVVGFLVFGEGRF